MIQSQYICSSKWKPWGSSVCKNLIIVSCNITLLKSFNLEGGIAILNPDVDTKNLHWYHVTRDPLRVFSNFFRFWSWLYYCWIIRHITGCSSVQINVDVVLSSIRVDEYHSHGQQSCEISVYHVIPWSPRPALLLYVPFELYAFDESFFLMFSLHYI